MLYNVNIFGSYLICWQFEQIVLIDIFNRKSHFFVHSFLERRNPSYAVVRELFILVGGAGDNDGIDIETKKSSY